MEIASLPPVHTPEFHRSHTQDNALDIQKWTSKRTTSSTDLPDFSRNIVCQNEEITTFRIGVTYICRQAYSRKSKRRLIRGAYKLTWHCLKKIHLLQVHAISCTINWSKVSRTRTAHQGNSESLLTAPTTEIWSKTSQASVPFAR